MLGLVRRYFTDGKVEVRAPASKIDAFYSPWYGWFMERLLQSVQPLTDEPEGPRYEQRRGAGSTADVDLWTSRPVAAVARSHVNFVVGDTKRWEQACAFELDKNAAVRCFVKNAGLGFAIPYFHDGAAHDYLPDYIVRLDSEEESYLVLEVKGFDPEEEIKAAAARRWCDAVNADGRYGRWLYRVTRGPSQLAAILAEVAAQDRSVTAA